MPDTPYPLHLDEAQIYIIQQLAEQTGRLSAIQASQDEFRKSLLGNGQPGRIQLMENEHDKLQAEVSGLHTKLSYFSGGAAVVGFLLGALKDLFISRH